MPARRPAGVRLGATIGIGLLVAMAWLGFVGRSPSSVASSCVEPSSPADAVMFGRVVFVGTTLKLQNLDRWATVRVDERWRGADQLPDVVEVHGGAGSDFATLSDRSYAPGRYLFVVEHGNGFLVDNACSGTVAWNDGLASFRPSGVEPAPVAGQGGPFSNPDLVPVAALLVALLIAVVSYLLILRSRNRPPDWMR